MTEFMANFRTIDIWWFISLCMVALSLIGLIVNLLARFNDRGLSTWQRDLTLVLLVVSSISFLASSVAIGYAR